MKITEKKLKEIILLEIDFDNMKKRNGIYETKNIQAGNNLCISIGISYEDLDDKENAYVYNFFINNVEYINISETGDINDKLPLAVLNEMVEVWNQLIKRGEN